MANTIGFTESDRDEIRGIDAWSRAFEERGRAEGAKANAIGSDRNERDTRGCRMLRPG
jgi:hypothetical protein